MVVDLSGIDPDDAFSTCPYEKGHTFLFTLEKLFGASKTILFKYYYTIILVCKIFIESKRNIKSNYFSAKFDVFFKSYIDKFKYKSVSTDDFKSYLLDYFKEDSATSSINWDLWLFTCGMPPIIPL